jgi:hypothetical protein
MAISYPLATPTSIGIESIELRAVSAVATSQSPFTFKQQVIAHTGQKWEASITIPPVHKDLAEPWVSMLTALKGPVGTFLLGDPNGVTPQGTASLGAGTPRVKNSQTPSDTIDIRGLPSSRTNFLIAGDYVQFGTGSAATLHKVLTTVTTSGSGTVSLDIWPSTRRTLADDEVVTLINAKGLFRLASTTTSWQINQSSIYGISFDAVEVIN